MHVCVLQYITTQVYYQRQCVYFRRYTRKTGTQKNKVFLVSAILLRLSPFPSIFSMKLPLMRTYGRNVLHWFLPFTFPAVAFFNLYAILSIVLILHILSDIISASLSITDISNTFACYSLHFSFCVRSIVACISVSYDVPQHLYRL